MGKRDRFMPSSILLARSQTQKASSRFRTCDGSIYNDNNSYTCASFFTHLSLSLSLNIYIYIERERERERWIRIESCEVKRLSSLKIYVCVCVKNCFRKKSADNKFFSFQTHIWFTCKSTVVFFAFDILRVEWG